MDTLDRETPLKRDVINKINTCNLNYKFFLYIERCFFDDEMCYNTCVDAKRHAERVKYMTTEIKLTELSKTSG